MMRSCFLIPFLHNTDAGARVGICDHIKCVKCGSWGHSTIGNLDLFDFTTLQWNCQLTVEPKFNAFSFTIAKKILRQMRE